MTTASKVILDSVLDQKRQHELKTIFKDIPHVITSDNVLYSTFSSLPDELKVNENYDGKQIVVLKPGGKWHATDYGKGYTDYLLNALERKLNHVFNSTEFDYILTLDPELDINSLPTPLELISLERYVDLNGKVLSDNPTLQSSVEKYRQTDHGQEFEDFDLFEQPQTLTKGNEPMNNPLDIVITSEQVAELKESIESPTYTLESEQSIEELDQTFAETTGRGLTSATIPLDESPLVHNPDYVKLPDTESVADGSVSNTNEKRVAIIGAGAGANIATFIDVASLPTREETQPEASETPNKDFNESNSQRKKRLAQQHNAAYKGNKIIVVKLRTQGLGVRLELMALTNRQIQTSKERGLFAIYTVNSAVAAPRLCELPIRQYHNKSLINQVTLDWLLDQLDENVAFEIRSGRIDLEKSGTKQVISKTADEWIAKGFYIRNGEVKFG